MAEYKKTRSPELKKEIERELRELERKLAELQAKAQKLASELPDQFLNNEAMGKNDLQKQLDDVRKMLEKGDIDKAMAELEKHVAVARPDDVVDGAGSEGLPRGALRRRGEGDGRAREQARRPRRRRAAGCATRPSTCSKRARAEAQRADEATRCDALQQARARESGSAEEAARRARSDVAVGLRPGGAGAHQEARRGHRARRSARATSTRRAAWRKQAHEGLRQMAMDLHDEETRSWTRTPPKLPQDARATSSDGRDAGARDRR